MFLVRVVKDSYHSHPEASADVKELMVCVIRQGIELNLLLGRFLFALRFRG